MRTGISAPRLASAAAGQAAGGRLRLPRRFMAAIAKGRIAVAAAGLLLGLAFGWGAAATGLAEAAGAAPIRQTTQAVALQEAPAPDAAPAGHAMDHGEEMGAGGLQAPLQGWALARALFEILSLLLIAALTIRQMLRLRYMERPAEMPLMMCCMGFSMAAGLAGGTILSVLLGQFALPAIGAGAAAAWAGYAAGSRHGAAPALEGLLGGAMGGLMGPMFGYMALPEHPLAAVLFAVALFIVVARLLGRLSRESRSEAAACLEPDGGG
ncbi:hypothetical protein HGI30_12660 [Paenibacillus albicereus]|uniref:Uncharacterized protein n=1 Tax=Paenibacillus albicereus TaxID=2726185 RepID=A0A6H2GYY3_9BACL|nr:hypothetical protein [Paenibacillus albicereus]QJC52328.1 hypothetical protein HGI30_12660 [Paenibacillus albicereus]